MTFTCGRKKDKPNKPDMKYGKDFTVEQIKLRNPKGLVKKTY